MTAKQRENSQVQLRQEFPLVVDVNECINNECTECTLSRLSNLSIHN